MNKPKAILISDIHFNLTTLPVASEALKQAVNKANDLKVPLIIPGDMHDTKANVRGECIKAIQDILYACHNRVHVVRGNHDSINEKSKDTALMFLRGDERIDIIVDNCYLPELGLWILPYEHDVERLRGVLKTIPKGSTLIMHQGVEGSHSGEYIQDKSAISHDDVKDFRVISGHYHRRQDIKTGRPRKGAVGLWSYIGNPYTLNFGEAEDPEKGFQILKEDGTLEFVPTKLRAHIVLDYSYDMIDDFMADMTVNYITASDLLWVKVRGPKDKLLKFTKEYITKTLKLEQSFKLDLIPDTQEVQETKTNKPLTQVELLDSLIDSLSNTDNNSKKRLKDMWKQFT